MAILHYRIDVRDPASRQVALSLEFEPTRLPHGASPLELFLPTWTPGSYLIREFARHLGRVSAWDAETERPIACRKVAKNRFRLEPTTDHPRRVRVTWTVYAHELSVRTADLTAAHAFWNHACLLLWPVGARAASARLTIMFPADWKLACALPAAARAAAGEPSSSSHNEAHLAARDLDHAMDSPCLVGQLQRAEWQTLGVPHAVVTEGLGSVVVPARLVADLQAIVDKAAAVFGGALPYSSYLFLCLFTADGHGGLEHAESTTLLMGRAAFASDKGYREFLSLAAHELFHAWNVKRMRPVEFWSYDYEAENCTEFLWLIEGWTAYYDDLLCLRAGLFTRAQYLDAAAKNVNGMLAAPGRFHSTLRESSFDAWIRLYRPDENTRNSSQNYYGNGAVAAMCLDLWLRRATDGARSLDDVLRELYARTYGQGRGYRLDDVHAVLHEVGGAAAIAQLEGLVGAPLDPALDDLLASFGLRMRARDTERPYLGVHFESGSVVIASVSRGSPACVAGLHPGDELLAVDDLRVDAARWADVWHAVARAGRAVRVLFARRGVVASCEVTPVPSPGTIALEVVDAPSPSAQRLLDAWLPSAPPTSKPPSAG